MKQPCSLPPRFDQPVWVRCLSALVQLQSGQYLHRNSGPLRLSMNARVKDLALGQLLLMMSLLLFGAAAACRTQEPLPSARDIPSPEAPRSEPTRPVDQFSTSVPATEIVINEDVERTSLFNINTLAYELPGMDEVKVLNLTYAYHEDQPLTMDIYYPPESGDQTEIPVVIFGMGYRMSMEPLRNAHFYTSWGKLVAAAGMVAIAYDTEQPDQDLEILMDFIQDNASALGIDPDQIGLLSTSANTATVMSYVMQESRDNLRFSIYYYGLALTPDRKFTELLAEDCARRGCLVAELPDVSYVDPELPLLVVKAGQDHLPNLNEAMDHFVAYAQEAGAPVVFVVYEEGLHGFDTQQKSAESAEIIAQTLQFMKDNFDID